MINLISRLILKESHISYLRNIIRSAKKDVDCHVYLESVVKNDFTTDVYICIDGTRIALITDDTVLNCPVIRKADAQKTIEYLKSQYFQAHKDELYGRH